MNIAIAALLSCSLLAADSLRPDLHAGGAKPSEIPNHAVTAVLLPGFHLSGAKVRLDGACRMVSYQVPSDNQIAMQIQGTRAVSAEDTCGIHVTTAHGTANTWIIVDLTPDEEQQRKAAKNDADAAKARAFVARSGTQWDIRYADGATDTFKSSGVSPDSMPLFHDKAGNDVKIAVSQDNSVFMMEGGCMLSGTLRNGQVSD